MKVDKVNTKYIIQESYKSVYKLVTAGVMVEVSGDNERIAIRPLTGMCVPFECPMTDVEDVERAVKYISEAIKLAKDSPHNS
jgi:hypothetical protein